LKRILVIGLDAAEPVLIDLWKDDLPNLSKIMREGVFGKLRSTDPPLSVPAWISLASGKNPGKIGAYSFLHRDRNSYNIKIVNSTLIRTQTLWDILSAKGKKVVVVGVPLTFPPERVNGVMVSGIPLPTKEGRPIADYTYPPEMAEEIEKLTGGYEVAARFESRFTEGLGSRFSNRTKNFDLKEVSVPSSGEGSRRGEEDWKTVLERTERNQLEVTKHLLHSVDWQYFMVVFRETDHIGHLMWKYFDESHPDFKKNASLSDAIKYVYRMLDEAVGEILSVVDKETVVLVVSDHGSGPLYRTFFVNEFLFKLGLLRLKPSKNLMLRISRMLHLGPDQLWRAVTFLKLQPILGLVPKGIRSKVRSIDLFEANVELIDWSKTKAYAFADFSIFLNVKDREPQGIVERGREYEQVRDLIIQKLGELKDPATGLKIDARAYKNEEIYWGQFANEGPDILYYVDDLRYAGNARLGAGSLFRPTDGLWSGNHTLHGIFMARGPEIRKNAQVNLGIYDVAPTILHIMGLPLPTDMDGKVALDIFEPGCECSSRPIVFEEASAKVSEVVEWSAEDEKKVEEQLRHLGYLG